MKTGKSGPKPLPTLTQIVLPSQLVQDYNTGPSVDRVLQRGVPTFEERVRVLLEKVLLEQKATLSLVLRSEIETVLREMRAVEGTPPGLSDTAVSVTKQLFDPGQHPAI